MEEDENVKLIENEFKNLRSMYTQYTEMTEEEIEDLEPEERILIKKILNKCSKRLDQLASDLEDIIAVEDFLANGPKGKEP